jgi:glucose-6-phosphate isomerase
VTSPGFRHLHLGPIEADVAAALAELADTEAVRRLWEGEHALWSPDPTEISDRLGWLHVPAEMAGAVEEVEGFVGGCRADGLTDVVVMGMGGSSLFPEVLARSFPDAPGLALHVLDSTDPAAVARIEAELDPETTLYLASSKSGTTIETRSHLEHVWAHVGRGDRFAVVTDPGSELAHLAAERGFRHVFENRPDIGGRYSALSFFGLVPAALAGVGWMALAAAAVRATPALQSNDPAVNAGLQLGAVLGAAARAGRDKVTFVIEPRFASFGLWLEQLIAESTGKQGHGVVPVVEEPLGPVDVYGDDRTFVAIGALDHGDAIGLEVLADAGHPVVALELGDPAELGAQVLVWEVATALCGALLGINPFDQPNVAEAKEATAKVLASGAAELPTTTLEEVLAQVAPGDYLALMAYIDPGSDDVGRIEEARALLRDELRVATTFGLGPRFLHSTGQLHKGGPATGAFLQIVGDDLADAQVPGQPFTFGELKRAQADGDLLTLAAHGLRAARVTVAELVLHASGGAIA